MILDYRYSKDQIFEAYLNEVFLGQFHQRAIHGFGLASRFYFAKPVKELEPHEFAVLVAIIKGPSYYNPRSKPERTLKRRDLVLRMMFEHHLLDKEEYQLAVTRPLGISAKSKFLPSRFPAFMGKVKEELKNVVRRQALQNEGIRVFTSLDPRVQLASDRAMEATLPALEQLHALQDIQGASVSVNIKDHTIAAMVGGRDVDYAGLNRALVMQRNIGSLIKPAIYLSALASPREYTLATPLKDDPITLENKAGQQWSPVNFDTKTEGQVSLLHALVRSKNIPTVNLGMSLGLEKVTDNLEKMGVSEPVPQYPSMFLGAMALSPLQVSQMYSTLAGRGVHSKLTTLLTITDNAGDVLWQRSPIASTPFATGPVYLTNYSPARSGCQWHGSAIGQIVARAASGR